MNFNFANSYGGADEASMKADIAELDRMTHTVTVKGSEIGFLSVEDEQPDENSIRCALMTLEYTREFERGGNRLQDLDVPKYFLGDELARDVISSRLLASVGEMTMGVDGDALWTIAQRAGLSGNTLQIPSKARNLLLSELITAGPAGKQDVTVLYRKDDVADHKKAYAFFGSQYRHTPQGRVFDVIDALATDYGEKFVFEGGSLTPYLTRASYQVPTEERKVVDAFGRTVADGTEKIGIEAINSDTGEASMTFLGYYVDGKGRKHYAGETSAKHTKELSAPFLSDKVEKEVFPLLMKVPADMLKLASIEESRSLEDFKKFLDMFVKKNFKRVTGEHRTSFVESTGKEYVDSTCWTMYDTAIALMGLPDVIGSKAWDCDADLRKDAGRVPALLVKYAGLS